MDETAAATRLADAVVRVDSGGSAVQPARLAAYATALDQETERARADATKGVIPPSFVLDTALTQLKEQRAVPAAKARVVTSLATRATDRKIAGDWAARATKT